MQMEDVAKRVDVTEQTVAQLTKTAQAWATTTDAKQTRTFLSDDNKSHFDTLHAQLCELDKQLSRSAGLSPIISPSSHDTALARIHPTMMAATTTTANVEQQLNQANQSHIALATAAESLHSSSQALRCRDIQTFNTAVSDEMPDSASPPSTFVPTDRSSPPIMPSYGSASFSSLSSSLPLSAALLLADANNNTMMTTTTIMDQKTHTGGGLYLGSAHKHPLIDKSAVVVTQRRPMSTAVQTLHTHLLARKKTTKQIDNLYRFTRLTSGNWECIVSLDGKLIASATLARKKDAREESARLALDWLKQNNL